MRYAVFLKFNMSAENALQNLRKNLAQTVKGVPGIEGKMGPHLTLAVFDSDEQNAILETFQKFAKTCEPITLNLDRIDNFNSRFKVLFVAPANSPKLQTQYERCHDLFSRTATMMPAYQDGQKWSPHITLTKGIRGLIFERAKNFAENNWAPIDATTQSIGLINVQRPLEVLKEKPLK